MMIDAAAVETADVQVAIPAGTTKLLANGFWENITPTVTELEKQLAEISQSQQLVLTELAAQGTVLQDDPAFQEVIETMSQLPVFHQKLLNIRKDMLAIVDKTGKMKKRVQKLEIKREKVDQKHALDREKEKKWEESLLAKPSGELGMDPLKPTLS